MDRQALLQMMQELDRELTTPCDLVLVGGAAMILHFGAHRATHDIDALVLRGDVQTLRQAIKTVAQQHNLPEDWLNEAVKGFADILPPDFYHRLTPLPLSLKRLRVYALGRAEQTAMKIVALREQDLEDLEILLPEMTEEDRAGLIAIMQHVATFRPDWAQKIRYFLLEAGWAIE